MDCLGMYENMQGQCESCPLALLCIDTAIALDAHYDSLANREKEIKEMEQDGRWCYELESASV